MCPRSSALSTMGREPPTYDPCDPVAGLFPQARSHTGNSGTHTSSRFGVARFYVRNALLRLTIPYELMKIEYVYPPDFIVRFPTNPGPVTSGRTVRTRAEAPRQVEETNSLAS